MYYKLYYLIAFLIFSTQFSFSQVTMGTVTPPAQGALLDLKEKDTTDGGANSTRGLNLPRVSLIAIDQLEPCAQTNSTNNKAHTGLIVYNTTDNSETDNTLTPGIYYWDGARWGPLNLGVISRGYGPWYQVDEPILPSYEVTTDSYLNAKAVVGGTDVINNATLSVNGNVGVNGKIGIGTSPNAVLDIRPNPSSTTDPGESFLGIGTTTVTAPDAGSGAIRYSTSSGGILEYSNGKTWNTLTSNVTKSIIVASKSTVQIFKSGENTYVTGWVKETDSNNDFDESTGIFTAPRTGNYTISFSFGCVRSSIIAGTSVQAFLNYQGSINGIKKALVSFPAAGVGSSGASMSFTFALKAGDTVRPSVFQDTGNDLTLRIYNSSTDTGGAGFNNLSIVEL